MSVKMKIYITYTRFYVNKNNKADPSQAFNELWGEEFTLHEYGLMGEPVNDSRILATIEYDETELPQKVFDRMMSNFSYHSFVKITADYACELCNEWYGDDTFELDEDNFTLVDLRPEEEE